MTKTYKKFIEIINKNKSSWINLLILSFIALIIKQYCNYITYKNLNYWTEFYINSFFTDAIVVIIVLWIVILNQYIKNRVLKIFNNIICLVIFAIFCIDIFTIYFLQSRVAIFQAFSYVSNWWNGFTSIVILILTIIIALRVISLIITQNIKKRKQQTKYILRSILLIFWWLTLNFSKPKEINNIISLNISFIQDIFLQDNVYALSEEYNSQDTTEEITENNIEETINSYEDYIKEIQWEWKDVNIILVFAESLSAIDSANMWWNNNTPRFDKIQRNGITFTNFIENGSISDAAHISTLYWIIPLVNIWVERPYTWYKLIMDPLPKFLNNQWYYTTFISAASLSFLNQREFLSWAWFQKIIWEEEFKNNKKYTFDAAPDKDLYDRVLKEVKNQTWKYFIWLQTISFHKPYDTPIGKTEAQALQYSDEELFRFYRKLDTMWFFESWILIILWDHRKMNAAEENEQTIFWKNRYVRPVATIIWTGITPWEINDNIIQHTDFYNSIKKLVWNWLVDIDSKYNDVFTKENNRERGITNSRFFDIKYTVTYKNRTWYTFNNISTLLEKEWDDFQQYMKRYLKFELWIDEEKNTKEKTTTWTIIIWHQWTRKLTSENSILWFFKAKELWWDWIEFDVSYTKDQKNIVAHWEYLSASNCNKVKIWNYTYDWIKKNCKLHNWEKYKTLTEMLEMVDWLFDYYFLEIKVYDESLWEKQAQEAIETVKKLNMQDRVIFISYSDVARKVLNEDPDIIFWRDTYDVNDLDFIWDNNSKYFLAPYDSLTSEIINKAKNLWKKVVTYTINDTWNYEKMVDYWVNIILTDDIQLLKDYQKSK